MKTSARSIAALSVSVLWLVGFTVGYASVHGLRSDWPQNPRNLDSWITTFSAILANNIGVALFLYSGVITFGLSTILGCLLIGLYIGATMAAAATNIGLAVAVASILLYAPLEFLGLLLASTAGLYPASRFIIGREGRKRADYADGIIESVKMLSLAVLLLIAAAALETTLILARN